VWGILWDDVVEEVRHRFIPTRVGNTGTLPTGRMPPPVHPHACGEYFLVILALVGLAGSSPRVWGIRRVGTKWKEVTAGSSPRVWGIPSRSAPLRLWRRFIPTRVGNTGAALPDGKIRIGSSPRVWGIRGATPAITEW